MYIQNPYAGWSNSNSQSQSSWAGSSSTSGQPATFGALPFSSSAGSSHPNLMFTFLSFQPNILNCTVVGPQNKVYFQVMNDAPTPGTTLFKNGAGKAAAIIEWKRSVGPVVEVRDIVQRCTVAQWIPLSDDQSYRRMEIDGKRYVWAPRDGAICLFTATSAPELVGRITKGDARVTLELTPEAVQKGLLVPAIVTAVLLHCGKQLE